MAIKKESSVVINKLPPIDILKSLNEKGYAESEIDAFLTKDILFVSGNSELKSSNELLRSETVQIRKILSKEQSLSGY